ncbi:hypothetical protein [Erwinia amylovora]|uniref:hypothetical protein n=1 Tax=Erwinia amylovora TaxID=552 RepID=UPI000C0715C4|nr:hypothetical protein [Erwinia amylovora]
MIVARPWKGETNDLLTGLEKEDVLITDLQNLPLKRIPAPECGWTHDSLEALENVAYDVSDKNDGWEMYLGTQWIGGSEV